MKERSLADLRLTRNNLSEEDQSGQVGLYELSVAEVS